MYPRDSSSRRICHPGSAGTRPTCSAARPYRALIRSTTRIRSLGRPCQAGAKRSGVNSSVCTMLPSTKAYLE